MSAIFRLFLLVFGVGGIAVGGSAYQADSPILQSGGMMAMVLGGLSLFFVVKMVWKTIGCLAILLVIFGILGFALYMSGFFDNGMQGAITNFTSLMGGGKTTSAPLSPQGSPDSQMVESQEKVHQEGKTIGSAFSSSMGSALEKRNPAKTSQPHTNQPQRRQQAPQIQGKAYVFSGDVVQVNGYNIRLFGIDAPEKNQRCTNGSGRPYHCGQKATNELKRMVGQNQVKCRPMQKKGRNIIGVCALGAYDLGVAMVSSGWAVAYRRFSKVYVPYEEKAKMEGKGLWGGEFYMPWDWREQQNRELKLKVTKHKVKKKAPKGVIKEDPLSTIFD